MTRASGCQGFRRGRRGSGEEKVARRETSGMALKISRAGGAQRSGRTYAAPIFNDTLSTGFTSDPSPPISEARASGSRSDLLP